MAQMGAHSAAGLRLVIGNRKTGLAVVRRSSLVDEEPGPAHIPDGGLTSCSFDRQVVTEVLKLHERNTNVFYLMVGFAYQLYTCRKRNRVGRAGR
jgi:dolichol-phosphate mannosyltransferase